MARLAPRVGALSAGSPLGRIGAVAVVVPNWNGAKQLRPCIRSLAAQDRDGFEIVVVENGSTDDSRAVLEEMVDEVAPLTLTVLHNERNLGFAGGVNRGIRHAIDFGFDAIALFNNDAVADQRWLSHLVDALDARPDAAIVTGRLLMADGRTVDSTGDFYTTWGLAFPRGRDRPAEDVERSGYVFGATGGASLFRSSLFLDIGLFDEEFFAYFEDVDLSFRSQLAGHRVFYTEHAVAFHEQGSTSRTVPGFGTTQFFRNLPMLLVKNVPAGLLAPIAARFALVYTLMVANAFRRGEGRAAVRGAVRGAGFVVRRGVAKRRSVQRVRRVANDDVRSLLWPGLPPGMRVLRGMRDRVRALIGRPRVGPPGR